MTKVGLIIPNKDLEGKISDNFGRITRHVKNNGGVAMFDIVENKCLSKYYCDTYHFNESTILVVYNGEDSNKSCIKIAANNPEIVASKLIDLVHGKMHYTNLEFN